MKALHDTNSWTSPSFVSYGLYLRAPGFDKIISWYAVRGMLIYQ